MKNVDENWPKICSHSPNFGMTPLKKNKNVHLMSTTVCDHPKGSMSKNVDFIFSKLAIFDGHFLTYDFDSFDGENSKKSDFCLVVFLLRIGY